MMTRRALLGILALLVASCSSAPPPPAMLTLNVIGGSNQNPDPTGSSAPVAVRVYQLNDPAKFERSDVFALTEREQQTLGPEDQGSEEFVLRPDETRTIKRELKQGVQFIGVAVLFRDIDQAHWRAVSPVAASGPSVLTLKISGLNAVLS
jgi:type VI secretion system protein VasD